MMKGGQMKTSRVYVDTSVIGGCHDDEFARESRALLKMAETGDIKLLVSELLITELSNAPQNVRELLAEVPTQNIEAVEVSDEAEELQKAYMLAEVVGEKHRNDALHVALATVARADLIVSWNFRHIVHLDKIRGFNAVNLREGYLPIEIRSPLEVV